MLLDRPLWCPKIAAACGAGADASVTLVTFVE
jgi:hypothetical protein